jgi:hypothetical protein
MFSQREDSAVEVLRNERDFLRARIAYLEQQVDELRKELITALHEKTRREIEYYKRAEAATRSMATGAIREAEQLASTPVETLPWAHTLMADGHIEGAVHSDEEIEVELQALDRERLREAGAREE